MPMLVPSAKLTLSSPLYACDFDPLDSNRLIVGGGGGAGRNGVENKIFVLDTSKSTEVEEVGDIDLQREEDNVTCLAVGQRKGKTTLVYAGVNSSPKDVAQGINEHFRVYGIDAAPKAKGQTTEAGGKAYQISALSKSSYFEEHSRDIYQRRLRLTRPFPNQPQLGAVSPAFAKDHCIVMFSSPVSISAPPKKIGTLQLDREAEDMDFIQTGANQYTFAYCDEHKIYTKILAPKTDMDAPDCIYTTPGSQDREKPTVPAFRSMRWLTPELLLMLTNIHGNAGAVLQILRVPQEGGQARVAQSLRLSSSLSKGTGLSVSNLTPPASPEDKQGYSQFVIAVSGNDMSIRLFKVDLQVEGNQSLVSPIKLFRTFNNVHPAAISGLTFSAFTPPSHPVTASTPPQYLKLASVSVANTVVVHTFPLFPVPLSVKKGQSKTPRYVVALPSDNAVFGISIVITMLAVLFGAILTQSILEVRGGVAPYLGASKWMPVHWQEAVGKPYVFPSDYASTLSTPSQAPDSPSPKSGTPSAQTPMLENWFQKIKESGEDGVIYLQGKEQEVKAHVLEASHAATALPKGAKSWDELAHGQKEAWKGKLKEAGHWAEGMGETIFKGVLFGELAGAVGAAAAG
ncbi:hypothetical protein BP5796_08447 [Coleophoma crateriformis]|uniref:Guanine nucleotide-exchange factor SEC12 n=1 Tax=Coleophoma crateriformis TaxID=565419 RepID=A0A3D8R7X9_9HELO|nr:hypothetical protein BP5796_08447 [Coleophoma crateriformis]